MTPERLAEIRDHHQRGALRHVQVERGELLAEVDLLSSALRRIAPHEYDRLHTSAKCGCTSPDGEYGCGLTAGHDGVHQHRSAGFNGDIIRRWTQEAA